MLASCWKVAYETKSKAMKWIRQKSGRWPGRFYIYRCPRCSKFHLTKQAQRHA